MRLRWFALLLLVVVGVAPLVLFGYLATVRSESTMVEEVRTGAQRLAHSIGSRIAAHVADERLRLETIGAAVLQAAKPELVQNAFTLQFPQLHDLAVYDDSGRQIAGPTSPPGDPDRAGVTARAIRGEAAAGPVRPAQPDASGPFAHTITVGGPVWIAGQRRGAVVARVDLIGIWEPVNDIRVGRKGFVRLVAADGTLLAHGDPEERRQVFATQDNVALVAAARKDGRLVNEQGVDTLAAVQEVGEYGWLVVVEQPVAEALREVHALRRYLLWLAGATLLIAAGIGVLAGRKLVRSIEALEAHTRVLSSGDLDAMMTPGSGIAEIDDLTAGVNKMASSLKEVHEETRQRDRLATFGRVAAGITHDIRLPLHNLRNTIENLVTHRDEEGWSLLEFTRTNDLPKITAYLADLERLAGGRHELEPREVDVSTFLEDIAAELRGSARWAHVSFEVDAPSLDVVVDDSLLRRAIYNLAVNAADASSRGDTVRLEAEPVGGSVEMRVRDSGIGMSPATLERVLRAEFYSSKDKGTGLGLSVARYVAEKHGARLTAASKVGSGTTFTLTLPGTEPAPSTVAR